MGRPKLKELPIMDEEVFKADPEVPGHSHSGPHHSVKLDHDSYVVVFEGRRGAGKTTAMTFTVVRAVALYNCRIISNYPIEFMMRRHKPDGKTYLQHVKSEQLDFEKLILFDEGYKNIIIAIDEAPDIISHMASISWKNRLVNAFIRQIRKNRNTLFLASQDFELIDKSVRWQTDIVIQCRDMARVAGDNANLENGELIELRFLDNSGQWTGESTEDRIRHEQDPWVMKWHLFPRVMWGDEEHKPVFDSFFQMDILESLRKVDLKLSSIKVGDNGVSEGERSLSDKLPVSPKILQISISLIDYCLQNNKDGKAFYQKWFYSSLGSISDRDKNNLGKILTRFNIGKGGDGSKRYYDFDGFDLAGFRNYVQQVEGIKEGEEISGRK